jgi:tetratricopeptide (TPR) repeat protein
MLAELREPADPPVTVEDRDPDRRVDLGHVVNCQSASAARAVGRPWPTRVHGRGFCCCFTYVFLAADASLATVSDGLHGDPRIALLETVRAFATSALRARGELDDVRRAHASHYLNVAQKLEFWSGGGDQVLESRNTFEAENDNFREVLAWALDSGVAGALSQEAVMVALRLCAQVHEAWRDGGYYEEGRRWLQLAVDNAGSEDSPDLGECLHGLSDLLCIQGDFTGAQAVAARSVAMGRRLGDTESLLSALVRLGYCCQLTGDFERARPPLEEAVSLARQTRNKSRLADALSRLSDLELHERNFERALDLSNAASTISAEVGDELDLLETRHNRSCVLRLMGYPEDAERQIGPDS